MSDHSSQTPALKGREPSALSGKALGASKAREPERWEFVQAVLDHPGEDNWFARLPPEKQAKVAKTHKQLKNGTNVNGPLWCFGPNKCPFHALCPLADIDHHGEVHAAPLDQYPMGQHCILEGAVYRQSVVSYMERLEVDHRDPVEMAMVKELALIDLQKQRAVNILSVGDSDGEGRDFMRKDTQITHVPNGENLESTTTQLHPLHDILQRLEVRREKWLTKLLATRKDKVDAQAKLGQKEEQVALNDTLLELREQFKSMTQVPIPGQKLIALD